MYNSDTELLFPLRVIPELRELRGPVWRDLVDQVSAPNADPSDQQAFVLIMVRMGGCVPCNADSFRAMRGCTQCARQTIRRYKGTDQDLVNQFLAARKEVHNHQQKIAS
jgi:hypothetical protein